MSCCPAIALMDFTNGTRSSRAALSRFFSRTKTKTRIVAKITSNPATGKGNRSLVAPRSGKMVSTSIRRANPIVPMMAAIPPMVLITPFASDRYSPGIVSGIKATTGPRADCLNTLRKKTVTISADRLIAAAYGK